jgi:hypothetical protein
MKNKTLIRRGKGKGKTKKKKKKKTKNKIFKHGRQGDKRICE